MLILKNKKQSRKKHQKLQKTSTYTTIKYTNGKTIEKPMQFNIKQYSI